MPSLKELKKNPLFYRLFRKVAHLYINIFSILEYLCLNRGRYVSKEELREKGFYYHSESNSLEVLISRIRKKLGSKHIIKSVKGLGYMVE